MTGSTLFFPLLILLIHSTVLLPQQKEKISVDKKSIYDFTTKTIDSRDRSLSQYIGKVLLIVNVAFFCGYTPQYKDQRETLRRFPTHFR